MGRRKKNKKTKPFLAKLLTPGHVAEQMEVYDSIKVGERFSNLIPKEIRKWANTSVIDKIQDPKLKKVLENDTTRNFLMGTMLKILFKPKNKNNEKSRKKRQPTNRRNSKN